MENYAHELAKASYAEVWALSAFQEIGASIYLSWVCTNWSDLTDG